MPSKLVSAKCQAVVIARSTIGRCERHGAHAVALAQAECVGGEGQQRKAVDARRSGGDERPPAAELAIAYKPQHVVGQAVGHRILLAERTRHHRRAADRVDIVARAFDGRAGVEDVDIALVAKALLLEHRARRKGVGVHGTDGIARRRRQQVDVHRMLRHQLGDERFLSGARQVVGARVFHREEMAAEPFPERARAVGLETPAQLGEDLRREELAELGDEQQPALREQRPVPADAITLVEEQRAKLAVSGVVVRQEQRRRHRIDAERARCMHQRADVVVVPGLAQPDRRFDGADPHDPLPARTRFHEHEHVARVLPRGDLVERRERALDALEQPLAVRGEGGQTAAGALGQREHRRQIIAGNRPNDEHGCSASAKHRRAAASVRETHRPPRSRYASARFNADSSRASPSRISSSEMTSDGAMRTTSGPAISTSNPAAPAAFTTSAALPRHASASSQPIHTPSPRRSRNTGRRALIARKPSMNSAWRALTPSSTSVVLMTSNTAPATAQASGLPPYVVPCTPTENALAMSAVVSMAPTGKPPPRPLALVRMSGTMFFCMYENSAPVRPMPLWISSRISSAPCALHRRRAACKYSGVPGVMPPSPCIGSRITAQVSLPCAANSASSAATSLYLRCVNPLGLGPKPLEYFACPPAVTVNSVRPWNALSVDMTRVRAGPERSCA